MDTYFIKNINWDTCINPINAIDFSAKLEELEKLASVLETLGIPFSKEVSTTVHTSEEDRYYTLSVQEHYVELLTCDNRIAPVPTHHINTIVPVLVLAHLNDPVSVIHVYNDFFINKKEEITPLLDK